MTLKFMLVHLQEYGIAETRTPTDLVAKCCGHICARLICLFRTVELQNKPTVTSNGDASYFGSENLSTTARVLVE